MNDLVNESGDLVNDLVDDCISRQAGQLNARVFQGIIVEYPSISAYPEYEGKPYFSIKYTENGQEFIGYGTYKPEVLSEFLKEYFMPPAQSSLYGYDLRNLIVFADAVNKKGISDSEIEDFVRNARAAWEYAWEEFQRTQKEALDSIMRGVQDPGDIADKPFTFVGGEKSDGTV